MSDRDFRLYCADILDSGAAILEFVKDLTFEEFCASQIRRSAVSIAANIVEGFKRKGSADKVRFYNIGQASLEETRYYLMLANDLGYVNTEDLMQDIDEVARMLDGYVRAFDK